MVGQTEKKASTSVQRLSLRVPNVIKEASQNISRRNCQSAYHECRKNLAFKFLSTIKVVEFIALSTSADPKYCSALIPN